MEGTILMKLYRNAISCGDYSDLNLESFGQRKKKAAEFARAHHQVSAPIFLYSVKSMKML